MRRRDQRSPSPAGSYRDRRDGRSYRRQTRSRSPERRYDDRDRRRARDRSVDRRDRDRDHDRDYYRTSRNHRERSRERYYSRRDDSRDRGRRDDDLADSRRRPRRDNSRDSVRSRDHGRGRDSPRHKEKPKEPVVNETKSAEQQQAERRARIEAWKAQKQQELEAKSAGTKSLLKEMDKKASTATATPTTTSATPSAESTPRDSPAPYSGKFDPKAFIRKTASTTSTAKALGGDIPVPKSAKPLPNGDAAKSKGTFKSALSNSASAASKSANQNGNIKGFGFSGMQTSDKPKVATRTGIGFDEEEETALKLEKLPTLAADDHDEGPAGDEQDEDEDDDGDMIAGTEEEIAAAARAAAERRAEARLEEEKAKAAEAAEAAEAADAAAAAAEPMDVSVDQSAEEPNGDRMEEDEEVDPLDAFMASLDSRPDASAQARTVTNSKKRKLQEPEELEADEGDVFDAIENSNPDDILAMAAKRTKKKDIPVQNHKNIQYEDVNFAFYKPPEDLLNMSEEALRDLRHELDGIRVKGLNCPAPVQKWAQCGLGVASLNVIERLGYEKPTSIQAQAIPAIMSGRDVIGVAKTGSGKTIAYLLPMFRHIKDQRPLRDGEGPIGLVIAPTRELATQIHRDCKPFLKVLNMRAVCTYGGAPIKDQIAELKRGAEIIVCTPGRIIELLAANSGRVTNLRRVTYVVLDEADRMFDLGFEPQITKVLDQIRPKRQTVLFSATFPAKMEALAKKVLRNPLEIQVGGRSVVAPEITQLVEVRDEKTKFVRLLQLLGELYNEDEDARTLIFVDRQESADGLLRELMVKGYPCNSIHGGKDQVDRDSTISDFKNGIFPVLIATSVAARGLDVKQLKLVVNYDCPNHLEDYVHRVGRTGRAGNKGTAVTFITEEQDRYAGALVKALTQSGTAVPEDLKKLADSFNDKVKSGQAKWAGGGFGGRGIEKYDELHEASRARERKSYKTGDEPEEEVDVEKKAGFKEDIVIKSRDTAAAPAPEAESVPGLPSLDASSIVIHKTETDPSAAANGNALDAVKRVAVGINSRLIQRGKIHPGQPIDNRGPDAGAFHATLEINDFPQKARWAVTNRTNVAKILEATGTSITTKGTFYPAGKTPGPNDMPKLYILVEGDTEIVVRNAMSELMRLLKEGTMAAADSEAKAPVGGRYKVV